MKLKELTRSLSLQDENQLSIDGHLGCQSPIENQCVCVLFGKYAMTK
jgi:hypothetical protein